MIERAQGAEDGDHSRVAETQSWIRIRVLRISDHNCQKSSIQFRDRVLEKAPSRSVLEGGIEPNFRIRFIGILQTGALGTGLHEAGYSTAQLQG